MLEAKRFLKQYQTLTVKIKELEEEIEHKQSVIDSISINYSGMPKSNKISMRTEDLAIYISDKKLELEQLKIAAEIKRDGIVDIIHRIDDALLNEILYKKYIELKEWKNIGEELYISERWAQIKHKDALKKVSFLIS